MNGSKTSFIILCELGVCVVKPALGDEGVWVDEVGRGSEGRLLGDAGSVLGWSVESPPDKAEEKATYTLWNWIAADGYARPVNLSRDGERARWVHAQRFLEDGVEVW